MFVLDTIAKTRVFWIQRATTRVVARFLFTLSDVLWNAFRGLVPFVQFLEYENHPWRIVTFSNVEGFSLQLY